MANLDYKKKYKELYSPPTKQPVLVDVPKLNYLMIDGNGDPNTSKDYQAALEALYSTSYTLKFALKKEGGQAYSVPPLEGLWWANDMENFRSLPKSAWLWTMMIMQPDFVTKKQVTAATKAAAAKKPGGAHDKLRFEALAEGKAVQIMHIGPYSAEGPTINKLHAFAAEQGYRLRGRHHEIYLGDPRRTAPAKLRTVIRQPVK